jgi:uncharacterized protein YchJ
VGDVVVKKMECPCGSGLDLADCCGLWHKGLAGGVCAPTPEALMRSRYSAYVLGLVDYLVATWLLWNLWRAARSVGAPSACTS